MWQESYLMNVRLFLIAIGCFGVVNATKKKCENLILTGQSSHKESQDKKVYYDQDGNALDLDVDLRLITVLRRAKNLQEARFKNNKHPVKKGDSHIIMPGSNPAARLSGMLMKFNKDKMNDNKFKYTNYRSPDGSKFYVRSY
jgi:hypothetical protein